MPKKKRKNCERQGKGSAISTLPSHNQQGLIVMRFPLVKQQLWLVTETAFHRTNMLAAHSSPLSSLSMPRELFWGLSLANSTEASKMIKCWLQRGNNFCAMKTVTKNEGCKFLQAMAWQENRGEKIPVRKRKGRTLFSVVD